MNILVFYPYSGIAGDMVIGALTNLIEKTQLISPEEFAPLNKFMRRYGEFRIEPYKLKFNNDEIEGKKVFTTYTGPLLTYKQARMIISKGIKELHFSSTYAMLARNILETLIHAETVVHSKLNIIVDTNLKREIKSTNNEHSITDFETPKKQKKETKSSRNTIDLEEITDEKSIFNDLCKNGLNIIGYVHNTSTVIPLQSGITTIELSKENKSDYNNNNDETDDSPYIEIKPEYQEGLRDIKSFSEIWIISYLHKAVSSSDYEKTIVYPEWDAEAVPRGVFATRSPIRPSRLGLSKAQIIKIEDNKLFLSQLDLLNNTPILDIKPTIGSVDRVNSSDGWLNNTAHLELHKKGIPHIHNPESGHLHEAGDIILDIIAPVYLLQLLKIEQFGYFPPINVGGGKITFSHGTHDVPAPATRQILHTHRMMWDYSSSIKKELTTPTGASILAGLRAFPIGKKRLEEDFSIIESGRGFGHKEFKNTINSLIVYLTETNKFRELME